MVSYKALNTNYEHLLLQIVCDHLLALLLYVIFSALLLLNLKYCCMFACDYQYLFLR